MSHQLHYYSSPHAGQLRYHDFAKLRESMYWRRKRRMNDGENSSPSSSSWMQRRSFFTGGNFGITGGGGGSSGGGGMLGGGGSSSNNPFRRTMRQMELKRLEQSADGNPDDAAAQYQFLYELARDHPEAVVERVRHPAFKGRALNGHATILYLQTLQRLNQLSLFDSHDIVQRLERSDAAASGPVVREWKKQLLEHKWTKAEQVQTLMHSLSTGQVPVTDAAAYQQQHQQHQHQGPVMAATAATAAAAPAAGVGLGGYGANLLGRAAAAAPPGVGPIRGMDPKHPVHVQVHRPGAGIGATILGMTLRFGAIFVVISAMGALLDDKGLGRGGIGGMNSASKHVQEAEESGRKIKFDDVKGVEEAKAELEEIVMYLRDPKKFTRLGGKLPRGVLLTGPPGTGKTLLAKAIAGEADVPFFYSSGSQFEEVYVGLGAKRIRELFEAAKKKKNAIVFIDEIDAVGGTRKLKDQSALKMTLNELLVQLDGFEQNDGIIVIGATNFIESLDAALLRPGRFDKHVVVPLPDVGGRKEILDMYAKKTKLAPDVDLNVLARGTTGFSGADLYNLINQAALKASVDGLNSITMSVMEYAKDKIIMGAERKTAVITPETARCTAYHEAGHAVVAVLTDGAQPIHKATIMPRGSALGMVTMLPEGDQTSQSYKEMIAFMDVAMGGRVAEEIVFGRENVTSGAMSDIQTATRIARNMVTKYGFSDDVGVVFHGGNTGEETASTQTRFTIDEEVKRLTASAHQRARQLLEKHQYEHELLAETLLEYETLTGDEVRDIVLRRIKPRRPVIKKKDNTGSNNNSGGESIKGGGGGGGRNRSKTRLAGMGRGRNDS